MIKFEIDTNPPAGSQSALNFISYPLDYSVVTQDLASNFAGKCHALLCRKYIKGRDWFDFIWYVNQKIKPNFELLTSAIDQQGPWAGQALTVGGDWLCDASDKINTINWQAASQEVSVFLRALERQSLSVWGVEFFLTKSGELKTYLSAR